MYGDCHKSLRRRGVPAKEAGGGAATGLLLPSEKELKLEDPNVGMTTGLGYCIEEEDPVEFAVRKGRYGQHVSEVESQVWNHKNSHEGAVSQIQAKI